MHYNQCMLLLDNQRYRGNIFCSLYAAGSYFHIKGIDIVNRTPRQVTHESEEPKTESSTTQKLLRVKDEEKQEKEHEPNHTHGVN